MENQEELNKQLNKTMELTAHLEILGGVLEFVSNMDLSNVSMNETQTVISEAVRESYTDQLIDSIQKTAAETTESIDEMQKQIE